MVTNLITNPNDFNLWTKSTGVSIQSDIGISPDEQMAADGFFTTASNTSLRVSSALTGGSVYYFSVYVKYTGLGRYFLLFSYDTVSVFNTVFFDIKLGKVLSKAASVTSTGMEYLGDSWYRCWFSFIPATSITWNFYVSFRNSDTGTGSGVYTVTYPTLPLALLWNGQLTLGALNTIVGVKTKINTDSSKYAVSLIGSPVTYSSAADGANRFITLPVPQEATHIMLCNQTTASAVYNPTTPMTDVRQGFSTSSDGRMVVPLKERANFHLMLPPDCKLTTQFTTGFPSVNKLTTRKAGRINCGCLVGDYVDASGNYWLADNKYASSYEGMYIDESKHVVTGTVEQALHLVTHARPTLTYTIPVPNGYYDVTLGLTEAYFTTANQRVFSVFIQGTEVITDLDVYSEVGTWVAYERSFVAKVTDNTLVIQGVASVDQVNFGYISFIKKGEL